MIRPWQLSTIHLMSNCMDRRKTTRRDLRTGAFYAWPMLYGWIFAGHQLGSAIAAMAGGVSQDQLASVMPAFIAAGFLCLLAAVLVLGFRRPAVAVAA